MATLAVAEGGAKGGVGMRQRELGRKRLRTIGNCDRYVSYAGLRELLVGSVLPERPW